LKYDWVKYSEFGVGRYFKQLKWLVIRNTSLVCRFWKKKTKNEEKNININYGYTQAIKKG
jgi:hypothetical protein